MKRKYLKTSVTIGREEVRDFLSILETIETAQEYAEEDLKDAVNSKDIESVKYTAVRVEELETSFWKLHNKLTDFGFQTRQDMFDFAYNLK